MTVVGRAWNRLSLPGKLFFTLAPLLLVTTIAVIAILVIFGQLIVDFLAANLPIVRFVVAVTAVLLMSVPTAFLIIYMEMKVIALMNLRLGPDRVGPYGSLLSVVGVLILAGTMSLNQIVLDQRGSFLDWFAFKQPLGLLIFFIAATAEANRTPFDLTEADSEIVAGFATEYSGMRFGFFFFAEYVNVFVVSALITTLFLGGWSSGIGLDLPIHLGLDLGSLGIELLLIVAAAPLVLTLLFA